ncbi:MAG: class I SAM-dependent methyltransferase [Eubacterium sp.]|nr:class I SAM-dependent methyltransferase [Eubacterium sp.]
MFWDKAAIGYDLFENIYNKEVNEKLVKEVSDMIKPDDYVLECACGTGMISKGIAPRCKYLIATDFSTGMLKKAKKNLEQYGNTKVRRTDIMQIRCKDETFDKVVAGNVIHLLDQPKEALSELIRTCKTGGTVIIPTYVNKEKNGKPNLFVRILEMLGADFKKEFDYAAYQKFYADMGYEDVEFELVDGRMPCAIAIVRK